MEYITEKSDISNTLNSTNICQSIWLDKLKLLTILQNNFDAPN